MDFALSAEQRDIRDQLARICADFDDDDWLARDRDRMFPHDFHAAMTRAGTGHAQECHVERYLRESLFPASRELIPSFIAERVLGQQKSYRASKPDLIAALQ